MTSCVSPMATRQAMRRATCSASTSACEPGEPGEPGERDVSGVSSGDGIAADYFDGRSARAHAVRLRIVGDELLIEGDEVSRRVPCAEVTWPERTRHGARVAHLADGASMHTRDSAAWDDWMKAGGRADSLVVKAQQSWRWVFASVVVLVVGLVAGYQWGLPWAARKAVVVLPHSVDESVGESPLASIDEDLMKPR